LIARAGFSFEQLEKAYWVGPKLLAYLYRGLARPSA